MALGEACKDLVGSDLEFPEFDPLGFTKKASREKVEWYRAAELKHGRVAMLAGLGQLTQYYYQLPDPVFSQVRYTFQCPQLISSAALKSFYSGRQTIQSIPTSLRRASPRCRSNISGYLCRRSVGAIQPSERRCCTWRSWFRPSKPAPF